MSRTRYIFSYRGTVYWGKYALSMLEKQYLGLVSNILPITRGINKTDRLKYMFQKLPHNEGYGNFLKAIREPRLAKGQRSLYIAELRRLGFSRPKRKNDKTITFRYPARQAQAPRGGVRGQGAPRG